MDVKVGIFAIKLGIDSLSSLLLPDLLYRLGNHAQPARFAVNLARVRNPSGKKEILGAVRSLTSDLGPGDFFLFFFAGHGFRVKENHVLVCAKDEFVDLEDEYAGLSVGRLKEANAWALEQDAGA